MKKKYNILWLGLTLGIILPLISMFVFYQTSYNYLELTGFLHTIIQANIHVQLLSICVVPNLLLFFLFIWTYRYLSARGVLLATFIFAIIIFAMKLLF